MSSHREAPEISKDPVADSTDVYAFVSPDQPGHGHADRQLHSARGPGRRPELLLVRRRRAVRDPRRQRRRRPSRTSPTSSGSGRSCGDPGHVPVQHRPDPVARQRELEQPPVLLGHPGQPGRTAWSCGSGLACPPCNIGPLSTPNYASLANAAVHGLPGGIKVFAGQRAEGFYVDLGAIFDLADLRPFENLHAQYGMNVFIRPRGRRQRHRPAERALDRHPGADLAAGGWQARQGDRPGLGDRRVDDGEPPAGQRVGRRRRPAGLERPVPPGVPAGQPADQRGADPAGAARTCGTRCRRPTTSSSPAATPTPSWPGCCPRSTRASSRTWPSW